MFKVNTKNAGTWERIDENHALQIHSKSCQVARHQSGPSTGGQNHLFEHIGNPGDFHDQRTSLQGIKKKCDLVSCYMDLDLLWFWRKISIQCFQARLRLEMECHRLMIDVTSLRLSTSPKYDTPPGCPQQKGTISIGYASEKPLIFRGQPSVLEGLFP